MTSLIYYKNLGVRRPDLLMEDVFYNFLEFDIYLRNTIERLENKNYEFDWKPIKPVKISLKFNPDNEEKMILAFSNSKYVYGDSECPKERRIRVISNKIGNFKLENIPESNMIYIKYGNEIISAEWDIDRDKSIEIRMIVPEELYSEEQEEDVINAVFESREVFDNAKCHRRSSIEILIKNRNKYKLKLDKIPKSTRLYLRFRTYNFWRQKQAFEILRDAPYPHHLPLLKLVQREGMTEWGTVEPVEIDDYLVLTDIAREGTEEQREFVRKALGSPDFAILEGPPGSGKTTTILEIIIQLLKEGKKILLVASTHVAVDNVLERLIDRDLNKLNVIPLRIGDQYVVSEKVRKYQFDNFINTERKRLLRFLETCELRTEAQETLFGVLNDEDQWKGAITKLALESANLICGTTIGVLQCPLIKNARSIEPIFDYMILDEASKTTFQEFLVPAVYCKKWILSGDIKQLSPYVEQETIIANLSTLLENVEKDICKNIYSVSAAVSPRYRKPGFLIPVSQESIQLISLYKQQVNGINNLISNNWKSIRRKRKIIDGGVTFYDIMKGCISLQDKLLLQGSNIVIGTKESINVAKFHIPPHLILKGISSEDILERRHKAFLNYYRIDEEEKSWEEEISWRLGRLHELKYDPDRYDEYEFQIQALLPWFMMPGNSDNNQNKNKSEKPHVDRNKVVRQEIDKIRRISLPSILELIQTGFESERSRQDRFKLHLKNAHTLDRGEINRDINDAFFEELNISLEGSKINKIDDKKWSVQYKYRTFIIENVETHLRVYERFNRALFDGLPKDVFRDRYIKLSYQYRMHPEISEFPRKYIYKDEALMDPSIIGFDRVWGYNEYSSRRIWIDVKPGNKSKNVFSGRRISEPEMKGIEIHLKRFMDWAKNNPNPEPQSNGYWTIAILTFYRGQEKLISKKMQQIFEVDNFNYFKNKKFNVKVDVCTVDRFQGHEADIVFLSFVNHNRIGFLDNPNRLNVAITRPKYQLIIFGDKETFEKHSRTTELLSNLSKKTSGPISWGGY